MIPPPHQSGRPVGADAESMGAISKALRILGVLAHQGPILGLSEIARRSDIPKTSAFRVLGSLQHEGYVERSGKKYRLSWRVLELDRGAPFCEPGGLRDLALPHLSVLYQASGRSVSLAVLDGDQILYLARVHRYGSLPLPGGVGTRLPATCAALGKVILAFQPWETVAEIASHGLTALTPHSVASGKVLAEQLAGIRTHGLARDREEVALGVACLAAPVLRRGRAIAAISVSGPVDRMTDRALDGLLRRTAASVASDYANVLAGRRSVRL